MDFAVGHAWSRTWTDFVTMGKSLDFSDLLFPQ